MRLSQDMPQSSIPSLLFVVLLMLYTRNILACIESSSIHLYTNDVQLCTSFQAEGRLWSVDHVSSDLTLILNLPG